MFLCLQHNQLRNNTDYPEIKIVSQFEENLGKMCISQSFTIVAAFTYKFHTLNLTIMEVQKKPHS